MWQTNCRQIYTPSDPHRHNPPRTAISQIPTLRAHFWILLWQLICGRSSVGRSAPPQNGDLRFILIDLEHNCSFHSDFKSVTKVCLTGDWWNSQRWGTFMKNPSLKIFHYWHTWFWRGNMWPIKMGGKLWICLVTVNAHSLWTVLFSEGQVKCAIMTLGVLTNTPSLVECLSLRWAWWHS